MDKFMNANPLVGLALFVSSIPVSLATSYTLYHLSNYRPSTNNTSSSSYSSSSSSTVQRPLRLWMDGVFDATHFGHMNAFRLAKTSHPHTHLIVGINSDASTSECKGSPLLSEHQRKLLVQGCRWVDEVVTDVPYVMDEQYIQRILFEYDVDYIVHGDDACTVNGVDVYRAAKARGKFMSIPRTEGISTTQLIGRFLAPPTVQPRSTFLLTTSLLVAFMDGRSSVNQCSGRGVYVGGTWDVYDAAYIHLFRAARNLGDRLTVGVYSDDLCVFNHMERCLTVLGCRCVDDVLIDAPATVSRELVDRLGIAVVVVIKGSASPVPEGLRQTVTVVEVDCAPLTYKAEMITQLENQKEMFRNRFEAKIKGEEAYHELKYVRNS